MKSGASTAASYSYDYVGNRDVTTLGNGTSTEYDYDTDPRYRLDTMTHKKGANTLATIGYTATARDNAGNPKSMTDWTGTWDYSYDDNNRLISATPPNPVPDQPAGGDYGYDWVGNRLNPPTGTNHMVYNKADQLTSWPGMHTHTYYGDGSLHQVKDAGGTNVLRSYTYTPDGLLDEATYNNRTLANTWDGDKNRVSFTVASTTHNFVYDTTAGIPAVIQEDEVYYIREPGGSLIARISGSDTSYYHFDALGSTRLLTDSDGDVTDKYSYDAYGSLISHDEYTGSVDQPYQYVGELGYYTHWQEPEFGLMQLGVRFYASDTSGFTQVDPAQSSQNHYLYADGSPTVSVDPSGLEACLKIDPSTYICQGAEKGGGLIVRCLGTVCTIVSLILVPSPCGLTHEELRRECNDTAARCLERTEGLKIPAKQKKLLMDECYWCQMQCISKANEGSELPWPDTARCRYQNWPKGHRWN